MLPAAREGWDLAQLGFLLLALCIEALKVLDTCLELESGANVTLVVFSVVAKQCL